MIRLKQKNLPKLLQQTFREEAQKLELPSHQQLWTELQQRPEFAAIEKNAEQFFPQLDTQKRTRISLYTFYKKHPHLTGLIAAGLLIAVLLTRLAPFMEQAPILPQEQISAPEMGLQSQNLEKGKDSAAISSEKNDENAFLESFSLPDSGKETFSAQDMEKNLREEESTQSPTISGLRAGEISPPEKQPRNSQLGRSLRPVPAEQTFKDEGSFLQALKEARQLTPEEIWQVKSLPDNFSFKEGTIICTEESLLKITQEFAGTAKNEDGFTLIQEFMQKEVESETANADIATAQSLAQPIQVGPYRGDLFRPSPELCTLTWQQEKSFVTLSGQLTEEMLYQILTALENTSGG